MRRHWSSRPALLAGTLLAIFLLPTAISRGVDTDVARERTFFGVYRVASHVVS